MLQGILIIISVSTCMLVESAPVDDNKTQCIQDVIQWCNSRQYSNNSGVSVIATSLRNSGKFYRVLCVSDADGTNCSKNGMPWFTCDPSHAATYKGELLTTSSTDVDDEICETSHYARQELSIRNFFWNSTELHESMKPLYKHLEALHKQMENMLKSIQSVRFMPDDFMRGFGAGFPFGKDDDYDGGDSSIDNENENEKIGTERSNQIEKE